MADQHPRSVSSIPGRERGDGGDPWPVTGESDGDEDYEAGRMDDGRFSH